MVPMARFHVIRPDSSDLVVTVRLVVLLRIRAEAHGRLQSPLRAPRTWWWTTFGDGTYATPEQARAIAVKMIASYKDWGDGDYDAPVWLWNKESMAGMPPTEQRAYGIPRALPASKLASAGDDWKDNAATQIRWGLHYIAGRYGSPSAAKTFWLAHNWY